MTNVDFKTKEGKLLGTFIILDKSKLTLVEDNWMFVDWSSVKND
jgi:hypothetical protein